MFLSIAIGLVIFSAGCKDEDELGLALLPPGDNLFTTFSDTTTVVTETKLEDSLRTDELSYQLLGKYNDPIFGISTANVYAQVNLEGTPAFGNLPHADSLILCLAYSGYYGDTVTLEQKIDVYRLTEDMHVDSNYYSDRTFATDFTALGSFPFYPRPNTKIVLPTDTTDTLGAQIRINLGTTLAQEILDLNGQSQLSSNENWLAYFKGLYLDMGNPPIPPSSGQGAISYFNFFSSNSVLRLYFHDDTSTVIRHYDFSLTGARLNSFKHDYSGVVLPTSTDSISYVQAMCGLKTKITFPFLKHFLDSGSILINRAELRIIAEPDTAPFSLPERMLLVTTNASGQTIFPIDYYEASGYYGGTLNSDNGYTFNIARHLQRYLNGTESSADFYLIVYGSGVEANRAIIKSGSNPSDRMKLSLFYTKLN